MSSDKLVRIIVIYRPPPSRKNSFTTKQFLDEFGDYMENVIVSSGLLLVTGDFNFHVNNPDSRDSQAFLDLVKSLGLKQHVSDVTHRSGHTLDLVLTRTYESHVSSVVALDHGFPDHYPVFMHLSATKPKLPTKVITYRRMKAVTSDNLIGAISRSEIPAASIESSSEDLIELYNTQLQSIVDELAPLKTKSITIRPEAVWYNDSIQKAKQHRRQAERLWRKQNKTAYPS